MPAARYITLGEAEEEKLRALENNRHLNEKVRVRTQVLRLLHRGLSVEEIASYTGRHSTTVLRDFRRWEKRGLAGLADGVIPGRRSPVGEQERRFTVGKLQEERSWTAGQLGRVCKRSAVLVSASVPS